MDGSGGQGGQRGWARHIGPKIRQLKQSSQLGLGILRTKTKQEDFGKRHGQEERRRSEGLALSGSV